jgi:hypothetical protein
MLAALYADLSIVLQVLCNPIAPKVAHVVKTQAGAAVAALRTPSCRSHAHAHAHVHRVRAAPFLT